MHIQWFILKIFSNHFVTCFEIKTLLNFIFSFLTKTVLTFYKFITEEYPIQILNSKTFDNIWRENLIRGPQRSANQFSKTNKNNNAQSPGMFFLFNRLANTKQDAHLQYCIKHEYWFSDFECNNFKIYNFVKLNLFWTMTGTS